MVNTYGPTETTVIATYADLSPGQPVTIGRPIPGYRVHVLDGGLQPVPPGAAGEICIGGAGVARGYVGLPGETGARFVQDPFAPADEAGARLYRTGDLGRIDAEGNLEFLGRLDSQVKLRGFRVELAEIESVLLEVDGFLAAACALREDTPGVQQLVGYVVPRNGGKLDEDHLRSQIRSRLPAYMVPAVIETVDDLPRLPSGQLDRASLPAPRARHEKPSEPAARPPTGTERRIAEVWEALFRPQPISVEDDFFRNLGGHSLLAAQMVSRLRRDPRFARLGVLQAAGLYFVFGFRAIEWVTPYLVYFLLVEEGYPALKSAAWAAVSVMAMFPLLLLGAVATKWLVLGRVRAGRYPLWGAYYVRWWFVRALVSALPLNYLAGTPLLPRSEEHTS